MTSKKEQTPTPDEIWRLACANRPEELEEALNALPFNELIRVARGAARLRNAAHRSIQETNVRTSTKDHDDTTRETDERDSG